MLTKGHSDFVLTKIEAAGISGFAKLVCPDTQYFYFIYEPLNFALFGNRCKIYSDRVFGFAYIPAPFADLFHSLNYTLYFLLFFE